MADETMVEKMAYTMLRSFAEQGKTAAVMTILPEQAKVAMRAAISSYESHLKDSGMVIVPVEPTEAMVDVWLGLSGAAWLSDVPMQMDEAWSAMIKSFLPSPEQEG